MKKRKLAVVLASVILLGTGVTAFAKIPFVQNEFSFFENLIF